jgi:hypothetical protein
LDNKKNSSDNVGSGAEQVDAAQTNDASANSSGLVNIGDIPSFSNSTFNSADVQFAGLDESK